MEEYQYYGLELTPNVFAELLIQLFDGKQFKRDRAVMEVTEYHRNKGGVLSKTEYISVFKKACQILNAKGMTNVGYGTWRLCFHETKAEIIQVSEEKIDDIVADVVIGDGAKAVYVYYFDVYKKLALAKGAAYWECKVGRSDKDPLQRIIGQSGTCYPELPHIALIIRCHNSHQLEAAIHNILKLRNRWIEDAPGSEWFMTTPNEIEEIFRYISDTEC